jgi:hypothetical protein
MSAPKRQWLSAGRCMAFALWAIENVELAEDVDAVRVAMRCTAPQAHALMRGLREARKRPARPPKARAVRRRLERTASFGAGGMQQRLSDVAAYERVFNQADARLAVLPLAPFPRVMQSSGAISASAPEREDGAGPDAHAGLGPSADFSDAGS